MKKIRFFRASGGLGHYLVYLVLPNGGGTQLLGGVSRDSQQRYLWRNNRQDTVYDSRAAAARALA